jgi:hypothetical protein
LNSLKPVLQHCSRYQPLNSAKLVLEWCERQVFSPVWESINFVVIHCNISHISMTFRSRELLCPHSGAFIFLLCFHVSTLRSSGACILANAIVACLDLSALVRQWSFNL